MNIMGYAYLEVNDEIISENFVTFLPDKHLKLNKGKLDYELIETRDGYSLKLSSDTFMKFVEVRLEGEDIVFSDNYFHLIPNRDKLISFTSKSSLEEIRNKIRVRSLVDTY